MPDVLYNWIPVPVLAYLVWVLLKAKLSDISTKLDKIETLQKSVSALQIELRNFVTLTHHETSQTTQDEKIAALRERVAVLEDRTKRV